MKCTEFKGKCTHSYNHDGITTENGINTLTLKQRQMDRETDGEDEMCNACGTKENMGKEKRTERSESRIEQYKVQCTNARANECTNQPNKQTVQSVVACL